MELSCACAWRMYMLVAPVTRCSATLSVHGCARDDPREHLPPRARSGTYSSWYSACSTDERSSPIIKPALHVRRRLETGQREASFCELWIVPFNSHFHKAALRLPKHVVGRRPSSRWAASARPSHRSDAWRAHTRTSTASESIRYQVSDATLKKQRQMKGVHVRRDLIRRDELLVRALARRPPPVQQHVEKQGG
jgi:hypothetical protein